ncbi:hypothetical protein CHUAL_003082 [Chamberlinius hualienensis]
MGEHDLDQRIRLVVLGGGGVGKTGVIKRFLFNQFDEKYRSTVEDLYYREYDLGRMTIKVDILDTAGDLQFPAMRRLSIATANAFLLIYAVDNADSFRAVRQIFEEIREHRPADFQEIPTMVVGNKTDLSTHTSSQAVRKEDVAEWVYCELPRMRVKVLECSAKTSANVIDIFRAFLQLARLPPPTARPDDAAGLKRRSSEYGSSSGRGNERRPSPSPRRGDGRMDDVMESSTSSSNRLKPRSRSLIRRSSKKTSKLGHNSVPSANDDCVPS